ncbi:uncharacterized protein [Arachis hypogaea]|uniref:uncharacterized protein n=1 Tax=Arachis hypogaea TaxID=3818 RepID=UPI000DED58CE|nr:uncharacterized protein LOC112785901 [Arachis hypogaea]
MRSRYENHFLLDGVFILQNTPILRRRRFSPIPSKSFIIGAFRPFTAVFEAPSHPFPNLSDSPSHPSQSLSFSFDADEFCYLLDAVFCRCSLKLVSVVADASTSSSRRRWFNDRYGKLSVKELPSFFSSLFLHYDCHDKDFIELSLQDSEKVFRRASNPRIVVFLLKSKPVGFLLNIGLLGQRVCLEDKDMVKAIQEDMNKYIKILVEVSWGKKVLLIEGKIDPESDKISDLTLCPLHPIEITLGSTDKDFVLSRLER